MMASLRKVKAYALGQADIQASPDELIAASVPVSTGDCRYCADPCDQGHDEYPKTWGVDMETQMFGSVKPYSRQVVISTGKSDWPHDISSESGSLAEYLDSAISSHKSDKSKPDSTSKSDLSNSKPELSNGKSSKKEKGGAGLYLSSKERKITILNGSHWTVCDDEREEAVLVLPDYKVVVGVPRTKEGAAAFHAGHLAPGVSRASASASSEGMKSWVLPYSCIILLCSHKRRDNKCGIAAPKLEHGFSVALEKEEWEVHTRLEDPDHYTFPSIESLEGSEEEKEDEILKQLKTLDPATAEHKKALILKNSHMGGHKFAGNCIVYLPQGACVWYGRVTPHTVEAVVKDTILGGKVLPALLRGGLNISKTGHSSLHDW